MSVVFRITAQMLDPTKILKKYHLEPGGAVQVVLENAVIKRSIPYCPHDTGVLENSPYTATKRGSGLIRYNGLQAHYLYFGQVYGPNFPIYEDDSGIPTKWRSRKGIKKHPTGRFLTYKQDQNEHAGPFWVERMWADHSQDIIREVRNAAGIK